MPITVPDKRGGIEAAATVSAPGGGGRRPGMNSGRSSAVFAHWSGCWGAGGGDAGAGNGTAGPADGAGVSPPSMDTSVPITAASEMDSTTAQAAGVTLFFHC